jgi:hypothetical protein
MDASYHEWIPLLPKLIDTERKTRFDSWWDSLVLLHDKNGVKFTRKDAVLELADMDGGAHVDPKLDSSYAALSRSNSFGWEAWVGTRRGSVENSPALPIVRQTAHEVVQTILEQMPEATI